VVDLDTMETEGRTRRPLVVQAGERNHLVGGNLPADTPVEAVGDSVHPVPHSIDRWLRGVGLFRAECYAAADCAEDEGEGTLGWVVLVVVTFVLVVVVVVGHGGRRGGS